MLYSKSKEDLIKEVDFIINSTEDKYSIALSEWKKWFDSIQISLPILDSDSNTFYRAYVGVNKIFGVQIWEYDEEQDINILIHNLIVNGPHENNSETTQILELRNTIK